MTTYCVFDIETVGLPFDEFDESQQEYLLRRTESEEEREQAIRMMALSPLTAQVVCIGISLYRSASRAIDDAELYRKGAFITDVAAGEERRNREHEQHGTFVYSSEKNIIDLFWRTLEKYPGMHLISFNGRNFDAPFLMLRSALHRIRPSRDLMKGTKFNYPLHTDLCDELSYYSFSKDGATKRYNFDFYTRSFGITSPKSLGVHGGNVAEYYAAGEIDTIAEYCMRDVEATWELFKVWHTYLKMD